MFLTDWIANWALHYDYVQELRNWESEFTNWMSLLIDLSTYIMVLEATYLKRLVFFW